MIRAAGFVLILILSAARGLAAEPPEVSGERIPQLRMEELEVLGTAPLRMEEVEVRGRRDKPDVLYLPGHRGITLPSPVRYDLFLDDMARPVFPREMSPGTGGAAGDQ
jgi:hypothetical protein